LNFSRLNVGTLINKIFFFMFGNSNFLVYLQLNIIAKYNKKG